MCAHELWERIAEDLISKEQERSPLVGAVFFVEFESLRGAYVKQNPVPERAPVAGRPIIDPSVHSDWFGVSLDGESGPLWAVVVGVGLRREESFRGLLAGRDEFIFYSHPDAPPSTATIAVHQHALIMEGVAEPAEGMSAGDAVADWLAKGVVRDVKHVLEDSRMRNAWAAILPFDNIHLDGTQ
ncbi:MAG: hypothetical protein V2A56_05545 [bacterium]